MLATNGFDDRIEGRVDGPISVTCLLKDTYMTRHRRAARASVELLGIAPTIHAPAGPGAVGF